MNNEQQKAEELAELLTAFAEGKQLEFLNDNGYWCDYAAPIKDIAEEFFCIEGIQIRIKPETKENREILFRAWHKKKNFMMEPHTIVDISWTEEVLHHRSTDYANSEFENRYQLTTFWNGDDFVGKDGTYWDVDFDDVDLEQFIGLLDKNGKKIFEGDKVKRTLKYNSQTCYGKVIFRKGAFCCDFGNLIFEDFDSSERIYEVIGTIHDHLLKGEQWMS